jgi:uncharacterized membrane protein YfcA
LDTLQLAILTGVAFATSILSAVVGMAGGMALLSVMLLFIEPLVAIPLHGVVQLVSNGSRVAIQRRHVDWEILARYSILLLPLGFVGLGFARSLQPETARALIGIFVLIATWTPRLLLLGTHPERAERGRRFVFLGGVVGLINVTVGATGPLIAPFFLNLSLTRHALIGTKAACQTAGHLAKLVVFGVAGFAFATWVPSLVLLCLAAIVGTWAGSRLLEGVSELWFTRLYKGVLSLIAVRLVLSDGIALLQLQ